MMVSDHGVLGRRSSPQGNDWSTMTQRGIAGAESTPLIRMSSLPRRYPKSERACVGIEQQLGRVVAQALMGRVGPVHPEPVTLSRADIGDVPVPHQVSA